VLIYPDIFFASDPDVQTLSLLNKPKSNYCPICPFYYSSYFYTGDARDDNVNENQVFDGSHNCCSSQSNVALQLYFNVLCFFLHQVICNSSRTCVTVRDR